MADTKFIGARSRSKEGPRHVTGRGLFTDDFTLPGMLQAMILRSPHAHAKMLSVDPSEALKNPNVMAVITPDDVKTLTKPFKPAALNEAIKHVFALTPAERQRRTDFLVQTQAERD